LLGDVFECPKFVRKAAMAAAVLRRERRQHDYVSHAFRSRSFQQLAGGATDGPRTEEQRLKPVECR
jgi:hypothetical protein